jgi:hypothetical protein
MSDIAATIMCRQLCFQHRLEPSAQMCGRQMMTDQPGRGSHMACQPLHKSVYSRNAVAVQTCTNARAAKDITSKQHVACSSKLSPCVRAVPGAALCVAHWSSSAALCGASTHCRSRQAASFARPQLSTSCRCTAGEGSHLAEQSM